MIGYINRFELNSPSFQVFVILKVTVSEEWLVNTHRDVLELDWELTHSQTSPGFYVSAVQVFRKHCGKRRNCS